MRILLGELAPTLGDPAANLARVRRALGSGAADLAVFPELYLSGYRLGDRHRSSALAPDPEGLAGVLAEAKRAVVPVVLGAPVRLPGRPGEVANAAVLARPDGTVALQVKRYLPTYGPFEEGQVFSPTDRSEPVDLGGRKLGLAICYDTFFPEVMRELALAGAELLVVISASPVTSRKLFDRLLPARAIENAVPVVYVNRVGVEDGIVFGGGSGAWDVRGDPCPVTVLPYAGEASEERVLLAEVDLDEAERWRPFRPVLRDLAARPAPSPRPSSA
ncbi:MAG TPA: carbon-nitrogen hydrolase family protein [Thermoplasmata archaeon]|nr:carbon-nitrogen hydrolase family protein [Thermoplasmata archaeon]